jgi:hypothetical protein
MPDERLDSMRQGIGAPPESPAAQQADAERRADLRANPSPPMESAMGGSNDADRAGEEADLGADLHRGLPDDRTRPDGGGAAADG